MKENTVFDKAVALLAHPVSISTIGLYSLNTFVFQRLAPNWWTGKLSDLTWLIFMPFAVTALLACLLPARHRRYAFPLSIIGIAFMFILVKATSFNGWMVSSLEKLTGMPISIVRDPTDLLVLVGLSATIFLWNQTRSRSRMKRDLGLILTPLLVLLSLADMAAPNLGITTVEFIDDSIVACNGYYGAYQSDDGGETWQPTQSGCAELITSPKYGEVWQDPMDENVQYTFKPGIIERSVDGGKTWQVDHQWVIPSEATQLYYRISNSVYTFGNQPPFSAAIQPRTGIIFFAMGHEGILKRAAGTESNYTWLAVGNYQKMDYQENRLLFNLLYGEWILVIAAGGAGVTLLDTKQNPGRLKKILLTLSLIGMVVCALVFPPAPTLASPYIGAFIPMGLIVLLLVMVPLTAIALINAGTKSKSLLFLYITGLLVISILSFVPFALWVYNIIPLYRNASLVAVALAILSIIGLQRVARKWIPAATTQP